MTLKEITKAIEIVALNQPSISMVVRNDIFRLNAFPKAKYGVFGWTQQQHTEEMETDLITYNFTFFYVDRLKADKSNEVEIQSVGMTTLSNIIRVLESMGIYADMWQYQTFNQKFHDECAGVYTNVSLQVNVNSVCDEEFPNMGAFNDSFNCDYEILKKSII